MKIFAKIAKHLVILLASFTFYTISYGQGFLKLADEIQGLKPSATFNFPSIEMNFTNPGMFGFLKQGIVVVDKDMSTLVCYRTDGSIAWTKTPPEKYISSIHVSENGGIITAYYPLNEVEGVTEVMTNSGDVVWRKKLDGAFIPSQTGKYLFSEASMTDVSPLTVIETATGNVLWQQESDEFQAKLLDEETLVHVIRGELSVIEMSTGSILASHDMKNHFNDDLSHTDWMISVSEDGNYFAVLGKSAQSKKDLIQSFNRKGELLWTKTLDRGGYSMLAGLSEDGSRLFLTRATDTKLYDNLSGNLLWNIEESILNNGALVTNKFIAIKQLPYQSEVFVLGDNGSVVKRFKSTSIFTKTKIPPVASGPRKIVSSKPNNNFIVEIKKDGQRNYIAIFANDNAKLQLK